MDRPPRKSAFGTGAHGLLPVKLDMSMYTGRARERSPLGRIGLTPSPNITGAKRTTPGLGKRRGLTPIRPSDLSSREASILFSLKKSPNQTARKSPKTRRCLYQDGVQGNQPRSVRKSVVPTKPAMRSLRRPAIRVAPESRLPKPTDVRKSKPETRSKAVVQGSSRHSVLQRPAIPKIAVAASNVHSNPSTSRQHKELQDVFEKQERVLKEQQEALQEQRRILQEQREILQEIESVKSSVEEQKAMLLEAKGAFSQILQEQRSILEQQKNLLEEAKSLSDHEFTANEKLIAKSSELDLNHCKENVANISVSEAAYRQMRRSLRCLGTPTLSCSNRKSKTQVKTPKTVLSNKVRAQLHNLLDE